MDVYDAILARRTIRKFRREPVQDTTLNKILNAGRLSPTGMNRQPLRFWAVRSPEKLAEIFPFTKYAGYLPDGSCSPSPEEGPSLIIVIAADRSLAPEGDDTSAGAAAMSMMLAALGDGVASCWMGAIDRQALCRICGIDGVRFQIHTILSMGYPAMASSEAEMDDIHGVKYYFDGQGRFKVPKRRMEDVATVLD